MVCGYKPYPVAHNDAAWKGRPLGSIRRETKCRPLSLYTWRWLLTRILCLRPNW